MGNSRRSFSALIIAGVSFLFVIGALLTALAETGFSPPKSEPATDTIIPVITSTYTPKPPTIEPDNPTAIPTEKTSESTATKEIATLTATFASSTVRSSATATATQTALAVCTTPTGWIKYKVQSGDTLFSIAIRYQTNVATLQAGNCLGSSTRIITGTTLWVPNNPTITPSKTAKPSATQIVCYSLTLSHSGSGNDPTASPEKSEGCTAGKYTAGEKVTLTASPAAGWTVSSWTGTDNNTSTAKTNTLTMPASNHTASVTYLAPTCYTLTLSRTGNGTLPTASLSNSAGCAVGTYVAGEKVNLTASPAAGWTVVSWTGTILNDNTSTTNSVTMPAANHNASVVYSQCFALTLTHTGAGADPTALPTNSTGCPVGSFVAGEVISLTAAPDGAGTISAWIGTDDDSLKTTTNTLTMPASIHTVTVTYNP